MTRGSWGRAQPTPPDHVDLPAGPWWWACQNPERQHDEWAAYSDACRACQLALGAAALVKPDAVLTLRNGDHTVIGHATAAESVARAVDAW